MPGTAWDGGGDHCSSILELVISSALKLLGGSSGAEMIENKS